MAKLYPEPRYDEVYHNGLKHMNSDKHTYSIKCGLCGRFAKVLAYGQYTNDYGYWVQYECSKCGIQEG